MAPLTTDQRNALWRSALALLAVVVVLFGLLLANKPPEKTVKFNAVCRSFVAPVALTLKLHAGAGEVQEAAAEGFDATITNMESVALNVEGSPLGEVRAQGFKLDRKVDRNATPPHLDVTPGGGLGRSELQVRPEAVVSSFGPAEARPWVRAESADGRGLELVLVSPVSALKGNRYQVDGITLPRLPKRPVENLQAEVKGEVPGAMVSLNSGDPGAAVRVWFRPATEEVPLFQRAPEGEGKGQASAGEVSNVPLLLQGCVNPDLRIQDKVAAGVIADRATDLKIKAISGTIDEIDIAGAANKNDVPRLRVRGRTQASSLQQDEHELLPTRVGEALDLPYAERGVAMIVLGFALFLTFKAVDRTLGVLLEYFFPRI